MGGFILVCMFRDIDNMYTSADSRVMSIMRSLG